MAATFFVFLDVQAIDKGDGFADQSFTHMSKSAMSDIPLLCLCDDYSHGIFLFHVPFYVLNSVS